MAWRRWLLVAFWSGIFALTHVPKLGKIRPPGLFDFPHSDKVAHFLMFAGWMTVWWWLLRREGRRITRRLIIVLIAGGAAYAVFDELSQALVGRKPSFLDFLADVLGMVSAAVVLSWRDRRRSSRS